jgi:hypothetical protein
MNVYQVKSINDDKDEYEKGSSEKYNDNNDTIQLTRLPISQLK